MASKSLLEEKLDSQQKRVREKIEVPIEKKLMLTVPEAAALIGVGLNLMYDLVLKPDPVKRKVRVMSIMVSTNTRRIPRIALENYINEEMEVAS